MHTPRAGQVYWQLPAEGSSRAHPGQVTIGSTLRLTGEPEHQHVLQGGGSFTELAAGRGFPPGKRAGGGGGLITGGPCWGPPPVTTNAASESTPVSATPLRTIWEPLPSPVTVRGN